MRSTTWNSWIRPKRKCAAVSNSARGRRTWKRRSNCAGPAEVAKELGMKIGAVYQAKSHVLKLLQQEVTFLDHSSGREVLS